MTMDYRSFSAKGPVEEEKPRADRRWWLLKNEEEMAKAIDATLLVINEQQANRRMQYMVSARLYGNLSVLGSMGLTTSQLSAIAAPLKDRVTYNVVQSATDTVTAKIAKNRPKPYFLTSGGDYRVQRKAKKLNKFVEGVFYENEAYKLGAQAFRDACVFGTGAVHVFERDKRVAFERVLAAELYVDEVDAFYGHPRQLHWVKNISRSVLKELNPDFEAQIEAAAPAKIGDATAIGTVADAVTVVESWHLPSGEDADDGKHVISVGPCVLFQEEWTRNDFPFAFLHWTQRLFGFWGQGLAEQIQNIQVEVNKLLWVIQRSMQLAGSFKIFVHINSKIVKEHLNNEFGSIINWAGETPPQYVTPPIIPPEMYSHLQTLKSSAFEVAGISQLSAASKKPDGLNSGKALREFNDIESDRFQLVGQDNERMYLDLARLSIACAKGMTGRGKYSVSVPGRGFMETVDWKDVDLTEDQYVMQCYPVSSLPNDPAGRLQTVQEYIQAGFLTPRQGRRLLDFPDLDAVENLANASEDYLTKVLDGMVDDGEYTPPDPNDDLATAKELALEYYQFGKATGLEEERLEMLRRFLSQLDGLQKLATPPPAPPGAPGGIAPPQANPTPPPTSDLIPNVPGLAA